jgi:hypothetical protein
MWATGHAETYRFFKPHPASKLSAVKEKMQEAFSLFDDSGDEEESKEQEQEVQSHQTQKRVRTESSAKVRREQAVANLLRWVSKDPYFTLSGSVEFQIDNEGNVSAAAVQDIPEAQLLLSLHPRFCLKAFHKPRGVTPGDFDAAALAVLARTKMLELNLGTTQFFARDDLSTLELQISLMWELCKGKGSFYWPYLEALNEPDLIFTNPLFWDDERVAGITESHPKAHKTLVAARQDINAISKVIAALLADEMAQFIGESSKPVHPVTFGFQSVEQLYKYAVGITLSRHFTNGDYVALVPFCDLFNGRPEGQHNVITERSPPVLKYKQYMQLKQFQAQVGLSSLHSSPALLPALLSVRIHSSILS